MASWLLGRDLRLVERVRLVGLDDQTFEENRRNSFLRLLIRGSNPVAIEDGGELFFRARDCGTIRATELTLTS